MIMNEYEEACRNLSDEPINKHLCRCCGSRDTSIIDDVRICRSCGVHSRIISMEYFVKVAVSFKADENAIDTELSHLAMDVIYGNDKKDFDRTPENGTIEDFSEIEFLGNE